MGTLAADNATKETIHNMFSNIWITEIEYQKDMKTSNRISVQSTTENNSVDIGTIKMW